MRRIRPERTLGILLLVFAQAAVVQAEEPLQGEIRFRAAGAEDPWVGQEVELHLELWTDGFSFSDQWFVPPEVSGGFLLQADATTLKLSETRAGSSWQGLRYTLLFYPQRAGRLEVPSFEVRFGARAGFGSEPAAFRFDTPALSLSPRLPPGAAEDGLLVTTSAFTVEASWTPPVDGEAAQFRVGDALTLRVERRASGVPGMVFEPLPRFALDGLGVYPEQARVEDRVNRGELTGVRVDTVSFVCERAGRFTLPELRFQWWDPERGVLSEKVVEAQALDVAANPSAGPGDSGSPARRISLKWLLWPAGLVLAGVLLGPRLVREINGVFRKRQALREAGEPWAFGMVRRACGSGEAAEAYNAITVWLARWPPAGPGLTLSAVAERFGDGELAREALELQRRLAAQSAGEWRGSELGRLLSRLRKNPVRKAKSRDALQPLNPERIRSA